jgi:hypothetical protein
LVQVDKKVSKGNITTIKITLSTKPLDTHNIGYQSRITENELTNKPLLKKKMKKIIKEVDLEEEVVLGEEVALKEEVDLEEEEFFLINHKSQLKKKNKL